MFIFIILTFSIYPTNTYDLRPGNPIPHADVLQDLIKSHFNNGSEYNGLIFHYLNGEDGVSDVDDVNVNILDVTSLRKLVNVFKKRYENVTEPNKLPSRRLSKGQAINNTLAPVLIPKAFNMMEQSIYATRYRLQDTDLYRNRFKDDTSYKIAMYVGSMDKILMKMDNLLREMKELSVKTHFLWYLIIYEKILTMNVDVGYMANQVWDLHHKFYKTAHGDGSDEDHGPDMRPDGHLMEGLDYPGKAGENDGPPMDDGPPDWMGGKGDGPPPPPPT